MKKYLYPAGVLLLIAVLARQPHPARDIAKLDPVRTVYVYREGELLQMQTDTGDRGSGPDLAAAAGNMKAEADREIYLETAEFVILSPEVELTGDFFTLLRPSARVLRTAQPPDLGTIGDYLAAHPPNTTLAQLRVP